MQSKPFVMGMVHVLKGVVIGVAAGLISTGFMMALMAGMRMLSVELPAPWHFILMLLPIGVYGAAGFSLWCSDRVALAGYGLYFVIVLIAGLVVADHPRLKGASPQQVIATPGQKKI